MKKLENEKIQNVEASIARSHIKKIAENNVGAGPVSARKEKGITLIALIITIIVMLILVMVSIQVLFNTGLFDAAGKATQKWNSEQEKESSMQVTIGNTTYGSIGEYLGTEEVDYEKLEERLKEKLSKESGNSAIDQYGNIVDLSIWNIEITGEDTCSIVGIYDAYTNATGEIGYTGALKGGAIEGNIPAFAKHGDKIYKVTSLKSIFSGLTGLTVFPEIPFTVTSIGEWAFHNCRGLTSATIPVSVTSIEYGAFAQCSGLTSINIPDGLTSIGDFAFLNCSGLTSINIPDGLTSIEYETFLRM